MGGAQIPESLHGLGLPPATAMDRIRGDRSRWSQEQGLAFLALDAIVPDWQQQLLGENEVLAMTLLDEALQ